MGEDRIGPDQRRKGFGFMIPIFVMIALSTVVSAEQNSEQNYINIIEPVSSRLVDGSTVYVGTLGPGQTVPVKFEALTTSGGKFGTGGRWDLIEVVSVPEGWTGFNSKVHENPLQVSVKADPYAPEGNYTVVVRVIDENNADNMGVMTVYLVFTVSHDIYDFTVNPDAVTTGVYQPARFKIHISNKGNAPDIFVVSTEGMRSWNFRKTVYVPAAEEREVIYEVVGTEEARVPVTINVESMSSSLLRGSKNVTVTVKSNLASDFHAVNNGMLLFPVMEAPLYAFMGLLSNLIPTG